MNNLLQPFSPFLSDKQMMLTCLRAGHEWQQLPNISKQHCLEKTELQGLNCVQRGCLGHSAHACQCWKTQRIWEVRGLALVAQERQAQGCCQWSNWTTHTITALERLSTDAFVQSSMHIRPILIFLTYIWNYTYLIISIIYLYTVHDTLHKMYMLFCRLSHPFHRCQRRCPFQP